MLWYRKSDPSTWIYELLPVNLAYPYFGYRTSDPSTWIYDLLPVNPKIHYEEKCTVLILFDQISICDILLICYGVK